MSTQDPQHLYVSLEDFFVSHEKSLAPFIGARVAQHAWGLKDVSAASEEGESACRRVQTAVAAAVGDRKADWVVLVSESHDIIGLEEWIEDTLGAADREMPRHETSYGDLDLNILTQLRCGMQLEAFHSGDWAKSKLSGLFDVAGFTELEPITRKLTTPLPHVIDALDRDLTFSTEGGGRHPYQCTVAVGAVCLRLAACGEEPETIIPVVRRMAVSNIGRAISRMGDELKDRFKGLVSTVQEQQAHLRLLPEGWPNPEIWASMQEWASRRFVGDNGLVGSDLFEGNWLARELPSDIHRKLAAPANAPATVPGLSDVDFGDRMARRREAAKSSLSTGPAARL